MAKICLVEKCSYPIFGKGYCKNHQYLRTDKKTSKKKVSLNNLTWKIFSLSVKIDHSDQNGVVQCCTCGSKMKYFGNRKCQTGHFIKRSISSTRYHRQNNHPQCSTCNEFNDGEYDKYMEFIINTYGGEKLKEIIELSRTTTQLREYNYLSIISDSAKIIQSNAIEKNLWDWKKSYFSTEEKGIINQQYDLF